MRVSINFNDHQVETFSSFVERISWEEARNKVVTDEEADGVLSALAKIRNQLLAELEKSEEMTA